MNIFESSDANLDTNTMKKQDMIHQCDIANGVAVLNQMDHLIDLHHIAQVVEQSLIQLWIDLCLELGYELTYFTDILH